MKKSIWKEWDLTGHDLQQLRFAYPVDLLIGSDKQLLEIRYETKITLVRPDGTTLELEPAKTSTLGPLLELLHQPVIRFAASDIGESILEFATGIQIHASPHDQFEAWSSQGFGKLRKASLLCGPGGGSPWG